MIKKEIIIQNLKIKYIQSNEFSPENTFVFLHGWKSESTHLSTIFKDLDNYIALDFPGFGESDNHEGVWGVSEYADFLKMFMKKLGIVAPILVGHSFGGSIAIKYVSCGGKIKRLILISSAGIRNKTKTIRLYGSIARISGLFFCLPFLTAHKKRLRKVFHGLIGSEDYAEAGMFEEDFKKIINEDLRCDMEKVEVKTFLIWGEEDKATPIGLAYKMSRLIKKSRLYVIKNAGHFVFLENPTDFEVAFKKSLC